MKQVIKFFIKLFKVLFLKKRYEVAGILLDEKEAETVRRFIVKSKHQKPLIANCKKIWRNKHGLY